MDAVGEDVAEDFAIDLYRLRSRKDYFYIVALQLGNRIGIVNMLPEQSHREQP